MKHLLSILFTISALLAPIHAQFDPFNDAGADKQAEKTETSLTSEVTSVAPGETFTVAITLKHAAGYHAYYKNPGGPGLPLEFTWKLPEGYEVKDFHWPTPHLYSSGGIQFYVHEGEYSLLADIVAPASAKVGEQVTITVTPSWQLCNDVGCDPPMSKEISTNITIAEKSEISVEQSAFFKTARSELPIENSESTITAQVTANTLTLTIKPNNGQLGNAHFVDDHGTTDAEQQQTLTSSADSYTLTIPRNPDISISETVTGLLVDQDHKKSALTIHVNSGQSATTTSNKGSSTTDSHGLLTKAPSKADLSAAALLYDAESKINYILLDGTKEKSLNFATALGFIFIGGFLLNLMPCVFPVLGIKVMGFAQQSGSDPRKIKIHGLVFMAGLVVSMWVLAGIIYTLIFAFGRDVNWGEQLTSPIFLAAMIMLLYLFGLNMAGVFEVGTSLTGAGGELQTKKGYSGSFFSGVLTTLIATPCSGPFLGSVMGYTLKQPPLMGMIIFTVFALGISLPYVVLAFFPALINKLPRPGAWMVTFKQLMAFALFATAAYFFQSFAKITGSSGASWLLMALVIAGLSVWAYGRFATPITPKTKKYLWGYAFPLLVAIGAFTITKTATEERAPTPPLTGSSWYPGVVEFNQSKKRIVWVDHTAHW